MFVSSNIDKVALNFKKKAERIQSNTNLSVQDACISCALLWKSMMPFKTNESRMMINYVVKDNIGFVISPANNHISNFGDFYLNLFLEGLPPARNITPGDTSTRVRNNPYKLRHGFFGAGALAAERTAPFFKGLISERIRGVFK